MSLLTRPDADRDEEFFKTLNRAYQIFNNEAERAAYNNFGLEAEKFITTENSP